MVKDLNGALNKAKARRGVYSKTIIWESGVSKSQFYRIIKGQEAPSAETKTKICKSLDLEKDQFDALFNQSKFEQETPSNPEKQTRKSYIWACLAGAVVTLSIVFLVTGGMQKKRPESRQTHVALTSDNTLFIADVTIPDGTSIPTNTTYVKTWRVKNTGNVIWKDRYLKRMTPSSGLVCSSPAMVPIPETAPGETIDISVTFKTPHLPGSCRTDWKTSDYRGNLFFPEMHGLFSIVTVVADKNFRPLPNSALNATGE